MIEVSFLSLLILGELLLVLGLACGVLLFTNLRRRKRDYRAAQKLVTAVKRDEERHKTAVSQLLESGYRYQGGELEETVAKLLRAKKIFYQDLVNAYLKRDAAAFGQLNIPLEALTDIYEQFKVPAAAGESDDQDGLVSEVDLEYLRDKNQRLSEELSQTMETMGRMLTEYSGMFEEASRDTDDEEGLTNITSDTSPAELQSDNSTDTAESPTSDGAEPGVRSVDAGAQEQSLDVLEEAVEGLLDDVAKQAEGDVEPSAEQPEATELREIEADEGDPDEMQMADEQDLSDAFDGLEEIDIDGDIDILSPDEDGEDPPHKTPAEGGG